MKTPIPRTVLYGRKNANMTENNASIRLHDWIEADEMVKTLPNDLLFLDDFKSEFHRGAGRMMRRSIPFDDDHFREMLEDVFAKICPFADLNGVTAIHWSKDANDHPIDHFQEFLSCMHMHEINGISWMRTVLRAHELMKRNSITEYDDRETGVPLASIIRGVDSNDTILLKTRLLDTIMRSCSDDVDIRDRMICLSFPGKIPMAGIDVMFAAVPSYFTSEPDYQAALPVFDDYMNPAYFPPDEIDMARFRGILRSCGTNMNAMSGFMHAAIELDKAVDCDERLAGTLSPIWPNGFICPNPNIMRLMLANLAEGYPMEYITELIISESDQC